MKKIFVLVLALALVMSLNVTALAAESKDVTVNVQGLTEADPVYSHTLSWDAPVFTYNFDGGKITWDPDTLTYSIEGAGANAGWDKGSYAITVANKSNDAVTVGVAFSGTTAATVSKDGVTATLSKTSFVVASADDAAYSATNLPTGSANISISGVPSMDAASSFTVGTVVVTITNGDNT